MTTMQPFTTLTAVAAPLLEDNVDTDQIIPARFLKYARADGYGRFLFHDRRFRQDGSENPDFVLNTAPCRNAQILVTGANFGGGSSREGAVYALADYGIRCVVAPSFGPIFYKNCFTNGLLPARAEAAGIAGIVADAQEGGRPLELTVDLDTTTITGEGGREVAFEVEPFFREMLLKGVDEIGLTLGLRKEIDAFEEQYLERYWFLKRAG